MAASVDPDASVRPRTRCADVRPRMAKADLTNRENREQYGKILRRASGIAGLNRDETAEALGVDKAQVSRWWSGDENAQTWRYRAHDKLRKALRLAEAEADGDVEIETVIRVRA